RNGRPIETKVSQGSYCISACTYIFVSGLLRDVENGGTFEPHGFSRFSGSRIDIAIQEATGKDGTLNPAELDLQIGRLRMMARLAPVLAAQDERFAFAAQWLAEFGDPRGVRRDAPLRAAMAFAKLSSPAQQFLTLLDSGLATQLPEIERTVALSAFTRMPSLGTAASVNHFDEQAAFSWMVRTIERAAGHYLVGIKDARTFKAGDNLLVAIKSLQNEIVGIVEDSIKTGIGPYLESRQNQIDVQGLVKLMFSVSIIYTRPLTREELCDFNIVNRDCSN
ncbi:MAG: hypothetical protein LW854_22865, partial [Rubrivivax sp.]|nr:hypothetical protein [Rubrivivax sp.]